MGPNDTCSLTIVPLGGLGEVGMNCLVLENRAAEPKPSRVAIDCGAAFPAPDTGTDIAHPRFDYLLEAPGAFAGLVLTHGHEDHIGAVPYLLAALLERGVRLRIWGPPYAIELCRDRLDDAGFAPDDAVLEALLPGTQLALGGMQFEPITVTHSIVDATALRIETPAGRVLHGGDFKLDPEPGDGRLTDEARLAQTGDEGVRLLLSDSTNVFAAGSAGSEASVREVLDELIGEATGRVVVGLFASNVLRLEALGQIARRRGRRLCLLGRSLRRHVAIARRLGRLTWPEQLLVPPDLGAELPPEQIMYLATGTQGEPRGALRRLASAQHPDLRLGPGDLVALSSRIIPGCGRAVLAMCDDLLALGVELRTRATDPAIHASGHAHREEQRRLIELVRPECFIPLHGTLMHLQQHARLARSLGVDDTLVLRNGERAQLDAGGLRRLEPVVAGKVFLAGERELCDEAVRERRAMGQAGMVFVAVNRSETGGIDAVALARGVADALAVGRDAEAAARAALSPTVMAGLDAAAAAERVRRAVRLRVAERLGYRPPVEVGITRW